MSFTRYELIPQFDSSQSFYRMAMVSVFDNGLLLRSYGTLVAEIDTETNEVELYNYWDASQTTLRHVKEFLRQNGFKAETKAQIKADYHG